MSPRVVRFQWDDANVFHIARHSVQPEEVQQAFLDPFAKNVGSEWRSNELRYEMIGEAADGRLLTIIFVVREGQVRPVTAHTADRKAAAAYRKRREYGH